MTSGFNRSGSFKSDRPKKTLVIEVDNADVKPLKTLIMAYSPQLPPRLATFLDKVGGLLDQSRE